MGFTDPELRALGELTLSEICLLERKVDGHVLRVQLDRAAFWIVVEQVRRESETHKLKNKLIRKDAPSEMMEALFGMGAKEYAACRRAIRAPRGVGRPSEPDEETARRVWLCWQRIGDGSRLARPDDWLRITEQTGVSLRVVWRLAQRWCHDDLAPAPLLGLVAPKNTHIGVD